MSALYLYLIKANIALCMFYLAYRLGLRRLTFYKLNRAFLLSGIVFSSLFPLVDVNDFFHRNETLARQVVTYVPDINNWQQLVQEQEMTVWSVLEWAFWAGVCVMFLRLLVQMASLLYLHRGTRNGVLHDQSVRLMDRPMNPFSFFRHIYINPELHSATELKSIVAHEAVHVKQWHSADVLLGELNNVFYWFNPGAWLMKTAIRENLEFLADRAILRSGVDAKAYQYSLLQVNQAQYAAGIANGFNFSHLKNRIKMMNKTRSSRLNLYRYGVLACVVCGALLSLNFTRPGAAVRDMVQDVKVTILGETKEAVPVKPASADTVKPVEKRLPPPVVKEVRRERTQAGKDEIKVNGSFETKPGEVVEGKVAGVTILSVNADTSQPASPVIRFRHDHSQPMYVIDGKEMTSAGMKQLNPNDIQSIDVLKGETARSLYGEKGVNGVIRITTKSKTITGAAATSGKNDVQEVAVVGRRTGRPVRTVASGGDKALNEVVVVGYGAKAGEDANGAVLKPVVVVGDTTQRLALVAAANTESSKTSVVNASSIAPNPSGGIFQFTYSLTGTHNGTLDVLDASGKSVLRKNLTSVSGTNKEQIDLRRQPSGTYFLLLSLDHGKTVIRSKLVKQ
ncbi:M56 family metallopeptidase [Chitinophaga lutea]